MAKLDNDMKDVVRRTNLCFAATVNADGSPNLSPKSTLVVHDDDHLLFANIASPRTIANLKRDPRIEINCIDIFSRRGYRFKGEASVRSAGTAAARAPTPGASSSTRDFFTTATPTPRIFRTSSTRMGSSG